MVQPSAVNGILSACDLVGESCRRASRQPNSKSSWYDLKNRETTLYQKAQEIVETAVASFLKNQPVKCTH